MFGSVLAFKKFMGLFRVVCDSKCRVTHSYMVHAVPGGPKFLYEVSFYTLSIYSHITESCQKSAARSGEELYSLEPDKGW